MNRWFEEKSLILLRLYGLCDIFKIKIAYSLLSEDWKEAI